MALTLNGIGPVMIKGRSCTPKIDTETRLRLGGIKSYDKTVDLVLASAFPDDEAYVRDFLSSAPIIEKEILHAYLVGGESAANSVIDGINENIKQIMSNAVKANND